MGSVSRVSVMPFNYEGKKERKEEREREKNWEFT